MQIRATVRCHVTPISKADIEDSTDVDKDVERLEPSGGL
jgi:hypothetical protein